MADQTLIIVTAARSYPGETVSGDAWQVDWHEHTCRLALIDGLGHGAAAADAAQAACAVLTAEPSLHPAAALQHCHVALRGTRGAAIVIVQIDLDSGQLTFAGVGNVEGRLRHAGRDHRLTSARGIVGATTPTIRPELFSLTSDWLLLLHSDGISSRFILPDPIDDPQHLADTILTTSGRTTDDATVVVVRPTTDGRVVGR